MNIALPEDGEQPIVSPHHQNHELIPDYELEQEENPLEPFTPYVLESEKEEPRVEEEEE